VLSVVKAVEDSEAERSATAKLSITVKPVDSNPPVITASSIEGYVDENAPVGTKVVDAKAKPIFLAVTDADLVSNSSAFYDFRLLLF
jgi:protocadherin-15